MRRLFVAVTLCTAFLLLAVFAGGALATLHKTGGASADELATLHSQSAASASWMGVHPRFVPATEAIGAVAAINGTLRDYYGSALSAAYVDWYVGASSNGHGTTDGSGLYSFPSVPAASGNGEITAASNDGNTWYDWWNLTWAAPGPTTFDMQPGGITVSATPGGPWAGSSIGTDVYTSAGTAGNKDAYEWFPGATSVKAPALPGTVSGIGVYFWTDEGTEATTVNGQAVSTAATLAQSVSVDEASAQRVWTGGANFKTNPWGSGKPGSKMKVWLQNYPTSWTNHINGYSENPSNSAPKSFGNFRSLSVNAHSRALTVPANAVPGYGYRIWLTHTNGPLQLGTWFQVCTLKSSKASISKGTGIRLSGIVPVQGHDGSTAGQRTKVYCLWHKGTAAQPTSFKPSGWHVLGYVNSSGYGAYRTPQIKLGATTTFVMYYPGDDWYNAAYTSPVKVTVR